MKQQIDKLYTETMQLIGKYHARKDLEAVGKLSSIGIRVKHLGDQIAANSLELESIEETLKHFSQNGASVSEPKLSSHRVFRLMHAGRKRATKIRVEIDWSKQGKSFPKEVIEEHLASTTMAKFLQRISEILGREILEKLSGLKIHRGPLVSKFPEKDFANHTSGEIYQNQRISGTDFFALTHSSTPQKVQNLQQACRFLGLHVGTVVVREVDK
ncbi:MAG TPA: hypothetical protein VK840_02915 [Candidatus Dormibacteraeota bacterium]|jgi:hypothetical protein|nr:hypothetical protein [Candidatus Dormibacteraeota bacterium]